jgi:hypothetical protein
MFVRAEIIEDNSLWRQRRYTASGCANGNNHRLVVIAEPCRIFVFKSHEVSFAQAATDGFTGRTTESPILIIIIRQVAGGSRNPRRHTFLSLLPKQISLQKAHNYSRLRSLNVDHSS